MAFATRPAARAGDLRALQSRWDYLAELRDTRLPLQPGNAEKNGGFTYLGTVTWSVLAKSSCVHDMNALTLDETILFCG